MTRDDPRIRRTRSQLQNSLLQVGAAKPFATITVADIVAQAEVSRSTFYDHYPDVETLLLTTLDAGVHPESDREPNEAVAGGDVPLLIHAFLEHVERNFVLYRSALGKQGTTSVVHALRHRIERDLHPWVDSAQADETLPGDVHAAAISGLVIGIVLYWLEMDPPASSSTAAHWIWRAVNQTLSSVTHPI